MSIGNLLYQDMGALTVPCNVTGALTGTMNIVVKRLDNMVFCHIPTFSGTANNTLSNIFITPVTTLPNQFVSLSLNVLPLFPINDSLGQLGYLLTGTSFTVHILEGNFNLTSGIQDQTFVWAVNNYQ